MLLKTCLVFCFVVVACWQDVQAAVLRENVEESATNIAVEQQEVSTTPLNSPGNVNDENDDDDDDSPRAVTRDEDEVIELAVTGDLAASDESKDADVKDTTTIAKKDNNDRNEYKNEKVDKIERSSKLLLLSSLKSHQKPIRDEVGEQESDEAHNKDKESTETELSTIIEDTTEDTEATTTFNYVESTTTTASIADELVNMQHKDKETMNNDENRTKGNFKLIENNNEKMDKIVEQHQPTHTEEYIACNSTFVADQEREIPNSNFGATILTHNESDDTDFFVIDDSDSHYDDLHEHSSELVDDTFTHIESGRHIYNHEPIIESFKVVPANSDHLIVDYVRSW